MAVIIDMDMPKSCSKCPLFNGEFGECQHLGFNLTNSLKTDFFEEREPNCPLKSADEMFKEIEYYKIMENPVAYILGVIHKYCDKEN